MAKTSKRSRYDELHDKYHRVLTTKAGTRYERLAALVFKALEDRNVVIHDLRLAGEDPEVLHQIDVTIAIRGERKRIVIECKDFDISGDKVGLDIIRNFRSVVEDTKVDEAIVITCNGFTKDAQKYARSKNIKLAVLRVFEQRDMEGRIARVILGITMAQPKNAGATLYMADEQHGQRFSAELAEIGVSTGFRNTDPIYVVGGSQRQQINQYMTDQMNKVIQRNGPKALQIKVPAKDLQIQVGSNAPIPFDGVIINFEVDEQSVTFDVVSQRVAELIFSGFDTDDIIIFGDQIQRFAIDPVTGELR